MGSVRMKIRITYDGNLIADIEANSLNETIEGLNEALSSEYNIEFEKRS